MRYLVIDLTYGIDEDSCHRVRYTFDRLTWVEEDLDRLIESIGKGPPSHIEQTYMAELS